MKVLHLSNTPLSNAPNNIVDVFNATGHEAKAILGRNRNTNKVFVGGSLFMDMSLDELVTWFEWADIIHMHNFAWEQDIFKMYHQLIKIAKTKPCVIQYHSPRHSTEYFEPTLSDPFFKGRRAVVGQYHPRMYPECEWIVPNPLPLHKPPYSSVNLKVKWSQRPLNVAYAPSNTSLKEWDYKGYDKIAPILQKLAHGRLLQKNIIVNQPYEMCIANKAWAHIGIEEFFTGSYHLSFLEFMALGCCTVGHLDEQTWSTLKLLVGEDGCADLPLVDTQTAEGLEQALRFFASDPETAKDLGIRSWEWMHKYWSPEKTAEHFVRMYERIY